MSRGERGFGRSVAIAAALPLAAIAAPADGREAEVPGPSMTLLSSAPPPATRKPVKVQPPSPGGLARIFRAMNQLQEPVAPLQPLPKPGTKGAPTPVAVGAGGSVAPVPRATGAVEAVAVSVNPIAPAPELKPQKIANILPLLGQVPPTPLLTYYDNSAFTPRSIALRSFRFVPSIKAGAGYSSNLYATDTNTVGTAVFRVMPALSFDNGRAINQIDGSVRLEANLNSFSRAENRYDLFSTFNYKRETDTTNFITLSATANRQSLARDNIDNLPTASSPQRYWLFGGEGHLQRASGKWAIDFGASVLRKSYLDTVVNNKPFDLSSRSNTRYGATVTTTRSIAPGIEALVQVDGNKREYDRLITYNPGTGAVTASANSSGFTAMAGLNFQSGGRWYGSARAGYTAQYYAQPLPDVAGFAYRVDITRVLSPSNTIRLAGERRVEETSSQRAVGRRRDEVSLTWNAWLLPQLNLNMVGRYDSYDFRVGGRHPTGYGSALETVYVLNPFVSLESSISYYRRVSGLEQDRFERIEALIGAKIAY